MLSFFWQFWRFLPMRASCWRRVKKLGLQVTVGIKPWIFPRAIFFICLENGNPQAASLSGWYLRIDCSQIQMVYFGKGSCLEFFHSTAVRLSTNAMLFKIDVFMLLDNYSLELVPHGIFKGRDSYRTSSLGTDCPKFSASCFVVIGYFLCLVNLLLAWLLAKTP